MKEKGVQDRQVEPIFGFILRCFRIMSYTLCPALPHRRPDKLPLSNTHTIHIDASSIVFQYTTHVDAPPPPPDGIIKFLNIASCSSASSASSSLVSFFRRFFLAGASDAAREPRSPLPVLKSESAQIAEHLTRAHRISGMTSGDLDG